MANQEIVTSFWMKPIPLRQFDWEAYFKGDEPNDNGWMMVGYGLTEDEACLDLLQWKELYEEIALNAS